MFFMISNSNDRKGLQSLMNAGEIVETLLGEGVPFERVNSILVQTGFADPVKAEKNIRLLAGRDTDYEAFRAILPHALPCFIDVADPDMALNNWERLVTVMRERVSHYEYLIANPGVLDLLLKVIGSSQYLADILMRNPGLVADILGTGSWRNPSGSRLLYDEIRGMLDAASDYDSKLAVIREFKHRHMLRIGTRDICGEPDVEDILTEITLLADVCIHVAFELAREDIRARYGRPIAQTDPNRESVAVMLALGKYGGEELNYSSDVDLMFIYSEEGETAPAPFTPGPPVPNSVFFSKLAEKCIDLLARVTEHGHVFRVDMRLRPMGSKGPLVSSLESHLSYYEIFGETWERQALLKARPVAGDLALGRQFLNEMRPFVYPKYLDHRGIREIQNLKRRIESEVDRQGRTRTEVKLGRGGIRDIEFTVQFLQLLNGGKQPELRNTNTLRALKTLERLGYLSSGEHTTLVDAYKFLRRLENRLQIMQNLQLHVLPSRLEGMEAIARSLGYRRSGARPAGELFAADYSRHTEKVRELFRKFFSKMFAGDARTSPVVDLILNPEPTEAEIEDTLGRYGFKNCSVAYENLRLLADGSPSSPHLSRARTFFHSIAPIVVQHLEQSPDPDMALNNLQRCVAAVGAPASFYEILAANPKAIEPFVALSSYSDHLIRLFVNDPGVLDFLMSTRILEEESSPEHIDKALARFIRINPNFYESVQRFKNGEILRIGLRDILGLADIVEVTRELSSVAEVMVGRVYQQCLAEHIERYGEPLHPDGAPATMAILGMGKLGGGEINYASDLDVVFVYSSEGQSRGGSAGPISCQHFFAGLAAALIKKMSELNPYGYLYKMDARLRPDGDQGLLAVSADYFMEYHRERSAHWEKLAMTKLRPVAGDKALGENVREFAHSVIYRPGFFCAAVVEEAQSMLRKIFEASRPEKPDGVQIKNAEGGIIEIEFLVQLLQLKYGPRVRKLRASNALGALQELVDGGYISRPAHDNLRATLVFLRRVENRLRLMHNRSLNELPTDRDALDKLALRLGTKAAADRSPGETLLETLEAYIQRSHRVFEEQIKELRKS